MHQKTIIIQSLVICSIILLLLLLDPRVRLVYIWVTWLTSHTQNTDLKRQLKVTMQLIIQEAVITCAMKHKVRLISFTVASKQRTSEVRLGWQYAFFQRLIASVHKWHQWLKVTQTLLPYHWPLCGNVVQLGSYVCIYGCPECNFWKKWHVTSLLKILKNVWGEGGG